MAHELVPATIEHAVQLSETMRKEDRDEVYAATGREPLEGLLASLEVTDDPRTGIIDGDIACICGVASLSVLSTVGIPWLLSSDTVDRYPISFIKGCKTYFTDYTKEYDLLVNYVDARYTKAHRWLKWMGFELYPPEPFGKMKMPFHKFDMRLDNV